MIKAIYDRKYLISELSVSVSEHGVGRKVCWLSSSWDLTSEPQGGDRDTNWACAGKTSKLFPVTHLLQVDYKATPRSASQIPTNWGPNIKLYEHIGAILIQI